MLVVLCYVECGDKVLLIRRKREPYTGYLAMLGGKVEAGESIVEAAFREIKEESGLEAEALEVVGVCSETVMAVEGREVLLEYDMALVRGVVASLKVIESGEGELCWIDKSVICCLGELVPTDSEMIQSYIIEEDAMPRHYTVAKSAAGRYSIENVVARSELREIY